MSFPAPISGEFGHVLWQWGHKVPFSWCCDIMNLGGGAKKVLASCCNRKAGLTMQQGIERGARFANSIKRKWITIICLWFAYLGSRQHRTRQKSHRRIAETASHFIKQKQQSKSIRSFSVIVYGVWKWKRHAVTYQGPQNPAASQNAE